MLQAISRERGGVPAILILARSRSHSGIPAEMTEYAAPLWLKRNAGFPAQPWFLIRVEP